MQRDNAKAMLFFFTYYGNMDETSIAAAKGMVVKTQSIATNSGVSNASRLLTYAGGKVQVGPAWVIYLVIIIGIIIIDYTIVKHASKGARMHFNRTVEGILTKDHEKAGHAKMNGETMTDVYNRFNSMWCRAYGMKSSWQRGGASKEGNSCKDNTSCNSTDLDKCGSRDACTSQTGRWDDVSNKCIQPIVCDLGCGANQMYADGRPCVWCGDRANCMHALQNYVKPDEGNYPNNAADDPLAGPHFKDDKNVMTECRHPRMLAEGKSTANENFRKDSTDTWASAIMKAGLVDPDAQDEEYDRVENAMQYYPIEKLQQYGYEEYPTEYE